jgi:hypothetical protein
MILAALLLPVAVVALVFLIERLALPAFLALMAVVVGYGIAANMTFQSVGKAFGLGFVSALEHTGLLVIAGSLVGALVLRQPLRGPAAAAAGAVAGLGGSAAGALALLQPAGSSAPRRALGIAITLLIVHALVVLRRWRSPPLRWSRPTSPPCSWSPFPPPPLPRRRCGCWWYMATPSAARCRSAGWRSRFRSRCWSCSRSPRCRASRWARAARANSIPESAGR